MNGMCITCHYDAKSDRVRTMIRLDEMLSRLNLDIKGIKNHLRFNWGSADKCKVGMMCNKTNENQRYYDRYTHELNLKLSAAIEQLKDEKVYHEVLNILRGKFPSVYTYFEREYRKNLS